MNKQSSALFAISAMTMACTMAFSGLAQASDQLSADEESVHHLDTVEVEDYLQKNGRTVISAEELAVKPSMTGSVADALRGEAFVQFDVNSRLSTAGAEITPPLISIRGSRPQETSYTINGIANNNSFNVGDITSASTLGSIPDGTAEALMIDTDLLDNITVLSENISAEYGNFTGGVVDARVRDAKTDRWHMKTWVRHTRDAWTKQHFTPAEAENDQPVASDHLQKEFKKTTAGVTFEGPLFDGKLGALVSYQKTHSSTPVWQTFTKTEGFERQKSTRDLDNFMLRLNTDKNADFYVAGTLNYTPYEADIYDKNTKDGHFTIEGGGLNFTLNTRAKLGFGVWTNDMGWIRSHTNRDCDNKIYYNWWTVPGGYANWGPEYTLSSHGDSKEGGMGSHEQEQDVFNWKTKLALNPLSTGPVEHRIKLGGEVQWKKVKTVTSGYVQYNHSREDKRNNDLSDTVVGNKTDGIIAGEQHANQKWTYLPVDESKDYTFAAAFLEDTMKWDRVTFRPGVRVAYDDVTKDTTVAPRLNLDVDVLNDGRFNINAGYNRYYGTEILQFATRAGSKRVIQTWNKSYNGADPASKPWNPGMPPRQSNHYNFDELDNPYSDEFVLGFSANVADTIVSLEGVTRDYRDQLKIRKQGYTDQVLTNEGKSDYKGITFGLSKAYDLGQFGRHTSRFEVSWSELKSDTYNVIDLFDMEHEDLNKLDDVYLDGQKIDYEDLPGNNMNAEWVLTYTHNASFMEDRLRTSLLMRWEAGCDGIHMLSRGEPDYESGKMKFVTIDNDDFFNADLSVNYDLIKTADSTLTLNMDVFNLFDNKNQFNSSFEAGSYSMGRQFYLGMSYQY